MTLSMNARSYQDGSVVLALHGELDYAGAVDLRTMISVIVCGRDAPSRLVVDLTGVNAVDVTGLGTLVVANRICRQVGVRLDVRSPGVLLRPLFGPTAGERLSAVTAVGTSRPMVHARAG